MIKIGAKLILVLIFYIKVNILHNIAINSQKYKGGYYEFYE